MTRKQKRQFGALKRLYARIKNCEPTFSQEKEMKALENALPASLINRLTKQTLEDVDAGVNVVRCDSKDELFDELEI